MICPTCHGRGIVPLDGGVDRRWERHACAPAYESTCITCDGDGELCDCCGQTRAACAQDQEIEIIELPPERIEP